jgi:hypothetical protein
METLRKVVAGLVAITACLIYAHASHAVAPVQKGQAPGYYRMMLGDFEIVALSDGTVVLEVRKLLTNTTPTRVDQLLLRSFLKDPVETSVNGYPKGHTMYMVESKGETLAVLGDLMHVAAVQFGNPSVTIEFDTDPKRAAAQRKKVYADGAKQKFWLAVAHLPFPGIGHIRADGQGYVYVPANYSVPR